jgi:Putative Flp pilus-assembly TadE/G-like
MDAGAASAANHGGRRREERGQVLPFFALALTAIIAMAALLFTGANALVVRRSLQNAGDAAALAAANLIQARTLTKTGSGCSPVANPDPGAPWPDLVTAARASVAINHPGFDLANVSVSCPPGKDNFAVQVDLLSTGESMFGGGDLRVATTSQAFNGLVIGSNYSVVTLDPYHASGWPNGRKGCPAVLISGGPTVVLDGSLQINSACPSTDSGGALGTNGNAANLTLNNGALIRMAGTYDPGPLVLSPAPLTGQPVIDDPLGTLDPIDSTGLPVRSASKLTINGTTQVLLPGVYEGGIELKSSAIAFLRPGVYVISNGELRIGAQASIFTIPSTLSSTSASTWETDCPASTTTIHTCGALILNTGMTAANDSIDVSAGATLKLRAYDAVADVSGSAPANPDQYTGLLIWQDGNPPTTNSWEQPVISLSGGGSVDVSGTVYAPQALVRMGGNSGGSGGGPVDLTLQFITYDLEFHGNTSFHFYYVESDFARPTD